jgi:2-polyprenyl-6-methoxyphenol hydroxylase-like FAD-dependent oxidoreductase
MNAHGRGRLRRIAFVAHMRGVQGMRQHAELHVGRGAYVGLNPLNSEVTNVALVVRAKDATAARGDALAFFRQSLEAFPGIAGRVAASTLVRPVMVTGPFDVRSRRVTGDGFALVGDAAEFFDPFTGEGIWSALVGARLLAESLDPLLQGSRPITDRALGSYRRARRRRFAAKWVVERVIGHAMRWPALFDGAVRRVDKTGMAATVIGITGDFVPVRRLLAPSTLWRLVAGEIGDQRSAIGDAANASTPSDLRSPIADLATVTSDRHSSTSDFRHG